MRCSTLASARPAKPLSLRSGSSQAGEDAFLDHRPLEPGE
jgi:hypothetical protein